MTKSDAFKRSMNSFSNKPGKKYNKLNSAKGPPVFLRSLTQYKDKSKFNQTRKTQRHKAGSLWYYLRVWCTSIIISRRRKNVLKFSERPQTHASAARQHLRLHGSLPSPETCIEKQTHSDPQRWEILRQSQQKHIIQRPPPVYPPHLDFISQLSRIFNGCKLSSQLVFCSSNQIREQACSLRPPEGTLAFYAFPRKRKVNSPVYCQNFQRKINLNLFSFSKFPCECRQE